MSYLNNFRGLAILSIIFVHSLSVIPGHPGTGVLIAGALFGQGTFYFVAIAGFLFSATTENFKYNDYLWSKLRTVIIPYLLMALPSVILYVSGFKNDHIWINIEWFEQLYIWQQVLYLYLTGASLGPLWFIPMIVLFYLASPLFAKLSRHQAILSAALLVALIVGLTANRPPHDSEALLAFLYFSPAFILGQLLNARKEIFMGRQIIYIALVVTGLGLFVAIATLVLDGEIATRLKLLVSIPTTIGLFGLFYHYLNRRSRWLDLFARISFYLFFIHGYFIGIFRTIVPKIFMDVPNAVVTLTTFAVTLLGCIVFYVIGRLIFGGRSRYIIGA